MGSCVMREYSDRQDSNVTQIFYTLSCFHVSSHLLREMFRAWQTTGSKQVIDTKPINRNQSSTHGMNPSLGRLVGFIRLRLFCQGSIATIDTR